MEAYREIRDEALTQLAAARSRGTDVQIAGR
jgi:hypothetical protein